MNVRLTIKQLQNGKWAAFTGAKYYTNTVRDTEREARVARLEEIGREAQDVLDAVDNQLRKLDAYDERDPHGYLA